MNLLYEGNVFSFNHADAIVYMSQTVLPSRLNRIRTVELVYNFPPRYYRKRRDHPGYDVDTWEETCRVLASMTGLEELQMHLDWPRFYFYVPEVILPLFAPLHQIRQTRVFKVHVPWEEVLDDLCHVEGIPFRILASGLRYEKWRSLKGSACCRFPKT